MFVVCMFVVRVASNKSVTEAVSLRHLVLLPYVTFCVVID